jgi:hypothetical protein
MHRYLTRCTMQAQVDRRGTIRDGRRPIRAQFYRLVEGCSNNLLCKMGSETGYALNTAREVLLGSKNIDPAQRHDVMVKPNYLDTNYL